MLRWIEWHLEGLSEWNWYYYGNSLFVWYFHPQHCWKIEPCANSRLPVSTSYTPLTRTVSASLSHTTHWHLRSTGSVDGRVNL